MFGLAFGSVSRSPWRAHVGQIGFQGLRSIAVSSGTRTVRWPNISSRKVSGTPANGDAAKRDDPLDLASASVCSIPDRAREMTGCKQIVRMSIRSVGSVRIMVLIKARSSALPSKSTWEKSSWRSWCQASPLQHANAVKR